MLERERLVVELRAEVARLDKRLSDPLEVTVQLPENFAVEMPAVVRKRTKSDVKQEILRPSQDETKWADADENDLPQLAKFAVEELGRSNVPPILLNQTVERIKKRIIMAKTNRTIRSLELGVIDSRIPPTAKVESIPQDILERIEAAERV